jgi:hypothetical protein
MPEGKSLPPNVMKRFRANKGKTIKAGRQLKTAILHISCEQQVDAVCLHIGS